MDNNSEYIPSLRDRLADNCNVAAKKNAARTAPGTAASNQGVALSDFHIELCNESAAIIDPEIQRDLLNIVRRLAELSRSKANIDDRNTEPAHLPSLNRVRETPSLP